MLFQRCAKRASRRMQSVALPTKRSSCAVQEHKPLELPVAAAGSFLEEHELGHCGLFPLKLYTKSLNSVAWIARSLRLAPEGTFKVFASENGWTASTICFVNLIREMHNVLQACEVS